MKPKLWTSCWLSCLNIEEWETESLSMRSVFIYIPHVAFPSAQKCQTTFFTKQSIGVALFFVQLLIVGTNSYSSQTQPCVLTSIFGELIFFFLYRWTGALYFARDLNVPLLGDKICFRKIWSDTDINTQNLFFFLRCHVSEFLITHYNSYRSSWRA